MSEMYSQVISYHGQLIRVKGRVDSPSQLPSSGGLNHVYLVGPENAETYTKYMWDMYEQRWIDIGETTLLNVEDLKGDQGPPGPKGDKGDMPDLVDNLTSTSTTAALTGNQGRILNTKVEQHTADHNVHVTPEDKIEWNKISDLDNKLDKTNNANVVYATDATGQQVTKPISEFATASDVANKVDKVEGKGLSTEDYTTEEKEKLARIEENANNFIVNNAVGIKDKIVTGVILLMKDENGYYMRTDGLGNHMLCYSENGYFAFPLDATVV